jgi:hypothetical protein
MLKIEKLKVNDKVVKRNLKAVHRGDAVLQLNDSTTCNGKFHVSRVGTGWMAEVSVACKEDEDVAIANAADVTLALTAKIRRMLKKGEKAIDISDIYTGNDSTVAGTDQPTSKTGGILEWAAEATANKMYEISFPLADATPATDPDAPNSARVLKAGEYRINILSRLVDDPEGTNMPNPTSFTVTRHCKANLDLA